MNYHKEHQQAYISNLILRSFDEEVGKYCDNLNISYTRFNILW